MKEISTYLQDNIIGQARTIDRQTKYIPGDMCWEYVMDILNVFQNTREAYVKP